MSDCGLSDSRFTDNRQSLPGFNAEVDAVKNVLAGFFGIFKPDISKLDVASEASYRSGVGDNGEIVARVENGKIIFGGEESVFGLPINPVEIPKRLLNHANILNDEDNGTGGDLTVDAEVDRVSENTPIPQIH